LYVQKTIESIVNQTYKKFELIVIDDGSTDGSSSLLRDLQKKYNFQLICRENKGLPYTLNEGILMARGGYVAFCASDDFWFRDKLEKQVDCIVKNPKVHVVFGNIMRVNSDGDLLFNRILPEASYDFNSIICGRAVLPAMTCLVSKQALVTVGMYDFNFKIEDWYMWCKLAYNGYKIYRIKDFLGYYRVHNNNIHHDLSFMLMEQEKILDLYLHHPIYKKAKGLWHLRAFNRLSRHYKKESFKYLLKIKLEKFSDFVLLLKGMLKLIILF